MRAALLGPGELGVELVPGGVVVADQVAVPAVQDAQARDRGAERDRIAAYQISRASGVRMVTACGAPAASSRAVRCRGAAHSPELDRAGITALLAEPAETAHQSGPKKRAKTDQADARLLRDLVADGKVRLFWIPPEQARELRALLQLHRT